MEFDKIYAVHLNIAFFDFDVIELVLGSPSKFFL